MEEEKRSGINIDLNSTSKDTTVHLVFYEINYISHAMVWSNEFINWLSVFIMSFALIRAVKRKKQSEVGSI